ncbi:hypothetical protein EMIT0P43_40332 [Pseudomonas jessenii]
MGFMVCRSGLPFALAAETQEAVHVFATDLLSRQWREDFGQYCPWTQRDKSKNTERTAESAG